MDGFPVIKKRFFGVQQENQQSCAVSADGKIVIALLGRSLCVVKGREKLQIPNESVDSFSMSRDGNFMATISTRASMKLWKLTADSMDCIWEYNGSNFIFKDVVCEMSSCGSIAIAAFGYPVNRSEIIVFQLLDDGSVIRKHSEIVEGDVSSLSVNVKNSLLVYTKHLTHVAQEEDVVIVDLNTFEELRCEKLPCSAFRHVSSSPCVAAEAPVVIVADSIELKWISRRCCLRKHAFVWDVRSQQIIARLETGPWNLSILGISADADKVVTCSNYGVLHEYQLGNKVVSESAAWHKAQFCFEEREYESTRAEIQKLISGHEAVKMEAAALKQIVKQLDDQNSKSKEEADKVFRLVQQIDMAAAEIRDSLISQPRSGSNSSHVSERREHVERQTAALIHSAEISKLVSRITESALRDGVNGSRTDCVLDLEEIKSGQTVMRLPCMHVFHKACILPYLESEMLPCCPIDRTPVPKDSLIPPSVGMGVRTVSCKLASTNGTPVGFSSLLLTIAWINRFMFRLLVEQQLVSAELSLSASAGLLGMSARRSLF
eukprot:IDg12999t1